MTIHANEDRVHDAELNAHLNPPAMDLDEHEAVIRQEPHTMLELITTSGDVCALVARWYRTREFGDLRRILAAIDGEVEAEAERRMGE